MNKLDLLGIREISERSGIAASALRYYESEGLIRADRTPGSQRRFQRSTLRRLAFIKAASNIGLSIQEIRDELARLPADRTPTKADWTRVSKHWRHRIDAQILDLEKLRDKLDSCIGCGCLSLARCAISNPEDVAAEQSPGAAYLGPTLRR